jgi:transcriptional regulator with XRE-family HTH domain
MPPSEVEKLIRELTAWVDAEYGRRADLARQLGVTRQRVTDWLAGRKTPTLEQGLAILGILKNAEKGGARSKGPVKRD